MAVIKMNFLSTALGMQTNVTICLPSYSFADRMGGRDDVYVPGMKYQTLWLLHGGSGDDSDFVNFSNIVRYADQHKLAVVMPADYNAAYTDTDGSKSFSFLVDELPKLCRAFFPLSEKREDNFVAGLSMGSHGAMKCAVARPEQYCAALMMSGASYRPGVPSVVPVVNGEFKLPDPNAPSPFPQGAIGGKLQDPEFIKGTVNDVYAVAAQNAENGTALPKMIFHCGDRDHALYRTLKAVEYLKAVGYDVDFILEPGFGHEWDFWDLSLRKAISEWLPIRHHAYYPGEE